MPIRLFHKTTKEYGVLILKDGFKDGEDGVVWLSRYMDEWGVDGNHVLEVTTDFGEEELGTFSVYVETEEVDAETDETIPSDPELGVESFTWYKIPAAVLNPRSTIRALSREEARRMNLDQDFDFPASDFIE